MNERQEIHCHACGRWVQFDIDLSLDGNHVLRCPNCDHEHCRVVRGGKITDIRWDQRNGATLAAYATGCTTNSVYANYASASTAANSTSCQIVYSAWANNAAGGAGHW